MQGIHWSVYTELVMTIQIMTYLPLTPTNQTPSERDEVQISAGTKSGHRLTSAHPTLTNQTPSEGDEVRRSIGKDRARWAPPPLPGSGSITSH